MATDLQRDLAEAIVANAKLPRDKRKNKKELLVSAGYSPTTAEATPSKIMEQKGVKESLESFGLTEGLITKALVEDINKKPQKRERELSLGAEILGMKKQQEGNNKTLILVVTGESAQRYAGRIPSIPEGSSE